MILLIEPVSKNYGTFIPAYSLPLMEIGSYVKGKLPEIEIRIISMPIDYGLPLKKEGKEKIYQEFLRDISEMSPKAIGISCTSIAQGEEAIKLCEFIKEHDPGIFTFLGGYFPTIYHEDIFIRTQAVDLIVVGEGEIPAVQIIECIEKGLDPKDENIPNLAWNENSHFHLTKQGVGFDLNEKTLLDLNLIRNPELYDILTYSFSRGCPYHCHYCMEDFIRPVRKQVPYKIVQQDLKNLSLQSNADHMVMCDPLFKSFDLTHLFREFKMKFFFETRGDVLEPAIISHMADTCSSMALGVESASYQTLRRMNKVKDRDHYAKYISNTMAIFKESQGNEIPIMVFLILGYPGDTEEDLAESLTFAEELSKHSGAGGHLFKVGECRVYPRTKTHNLALSLPDVIFDDDGVFGENVVRKPSLNLDFEKILLYMKKIFDLSNYTPKLHLAAQKLAPFIRLPIQALEDDMIPDKCFRGDGRSILNVQKESLATFTELGVRLREKYKEDMSGEKKTRYLPV